MHGERDKVKYTVRAQYSLIAKKPTLTLKITISNAKVLTVTYWVLPKTLDHVDSEVEELYRQAVDAYVARRRS